MSKTAWHATVLDKRDIRAENCFKRHGDVAFWTREGRVESWFQNDKASLRFWLTKLVPFAAAAKERRGREARAARVCDEKERAEMQKDKRECVQREIRREKGVEG